MKTIFSLSFVLLLSTACLAQKKPLDHSVYDGWQTVANTQISKRGNYIAYEVNPQEGDGRLIIHPKRGKDVVIPRGHQLTITPDERYAFCLIKPLFKDTRQAKLKKKKEHEMPRDTLAIIRLSGGGNIEKIAHVASYKTGRKASDALAYISADTTFIPKKERANKNIGKPLFIRNLKTQAVDTFRHVDAYHFDKYGRHLAMTLKEKKDSTTIAIYHMETRLTNMLRDSYRFHSLPTFDEEGTQLLFLASADTLSSGSKHCDLFYMKPTDPAPTRLIDHQSLKSLPRNWGITEDASPFFSHDGRRIFAGVAEYQAPKDTTLVPFETAGLDIWNWDAPELPPMMKAGLSREKKRTHLAVYQPDSHSLLPLTTSKYDRISRVNRGDAPYALSIDQSKTIVETQWNMQNEVQLSLVSLTTGRRTPIDTGCFERPQASPDGHFIIWYDLKTRQWMLYDVAKAEKRIAAAGIDVNWWDEEDDHPMLPEPYGLAGWTQGDRHLLLYDRYDIWKIPTAGGKPVCLTAGEGRRQQRTFRYINVKHDDEARYIAPRENMLLSVFDHHTKQNGYATVSAAPATQAAARPPRLLVFGDYDFTALRKAEDKQAYIYQRGNFQQPMDLYAADAALARPTRLSAINPQQADYNWGTAELYHWTAYDGTPLDGLLYKPENFDPQKQYPLMIYFYERRSETLFSYIMPQPSWSTVNITFYVSRGYVVFVPDIVYPLDGLPGEAAYNCVCSGAESLSSQPWIDRSRMAIQGQSWGGYQVAYLITRTNMFRAAGAGAPVANMTSAYGGIRWESGMSRQFQYEQSQSRVGKTLWQAPDLYLKNSPLFGLPSVTTPVLIMHNDNDGAVPWYQGIELFMGLRRLQKPAWLLEYNNEAHNLKERRNRRDLTIRMQQFFDHYMLGAPEPAWMKYGIPTLKKGQYFGLENADDRE